MKVEIKSITFRSGDWEHCMMCQPDKKVEAPYEVLINETCWIPACKKHLALYKKNYEPKDLAFKEWRKKGFQGGKEMTKFRINKPKWVWYNPPIVKGVSAK